MPRLDISLPLTNPVLIFALVLFIILFGPIILRKLRIPDVIGLIVAGMLIGPHGFNLMLRDSSIVLFGTVGMLYIMFLAAIEVDLSDFKRNTWKSILFGLATFLIPMGLGTLANSHLLQFGLLSSILLASVYASHTLIAYPIVSRYGVTKQRSVNITVGGTMITNVLALLVLAGVVSMAGGESENSVWLRMGVSAAAFAAVVMLGFPPLARWFFKEFNDSVSQYIFVLGLVFLAAFFAQVAGMEAIIGAFLAGFALNRLIPHTSPLMNRIEFVGNALFIPFFLIGVGMLVDLRVLTGNATAVLVAATMSGVATLAKYLAAVFTQKTLRLSPDERGMIFGLSNAQGAVTLAAVLIGYNIILGESGTGEPLRLLNEDVLNGAVLMILITTAISSFVTEKAARNLAVREELEEAAPSTTPPERILIPISNPGTIESLLTIAVMMKDPKNKEPLFALNVVDDQTDTVESIARSKKLLEKAARAASATDHRLEMLTRYDVNVTSGIIHAIKENFITDVIIGLHEKSKFAERLFGTKTDHLLDSTHQMIMISKSVQPLNTLKRIVVAVPSKAEFESGFVKWYERMNNLARQAGTTLLYFAHTDTLHKLRMLRDQTKATVETEYRDLDNWKRFPKISKELGSDDLLVVVVSRKTSISYNTLFEKIPGQLTRLFHGTSFIILYPEQFGEDPDSMIAVP